jgi:hypothetical protein
VRIFMQVIEEEEEEFGLRELPQKQDTTYTF